MRTAILLSLLVNLSSCAVNPDPAARQAMYEANMRILDGNKYIIHPRQDPYPIGLYVFQPYRRGY